MKHEGMPTPRLEEKRVEGLVAEGERERKSERERALAPPFISFSSPWACPMQIGLSQVRCFLYLRSSLWSLDLPLFYFRGLFSSLSFSHCHFGLLFPILTT